MSLARSAPLAAKSTKGLQFSEVRRVQQVVPRGRPSLSLETIFLSTAS